MPGGSNEIERYASEDRIKLVLNDTEEGRHTLFRTCHRNLLSSTLRITFTTKKLIFEPKTENTPV